jgi:hypothetical protein
MLLSRYLRACVLEQVLCEFACYFEDARWPAIIEGLTALRAACVEAQLPVRFSTIHACVPARFLLLTACSLSPPSTWRSTPCSSTAAASRTAASGARAPPAWLARSVR